MDNSLQPITHQLPAQRQLDAKSILSLVIRRKWIIILVALPIILVSLIATTRSVDSITATARIMLEAKQNDELAFGRTYVDYDVLLSSEAQVVVSIPVSSRAAAALIDSVPRLAAYDPAFAEVDTPLEVRDLLLGGVDCAQVGESTILSIIFRHTNAEFCLMAVGALTDAYIDFNIESHQNPRAIGFYNDQIATVQREIDSLMKSRVQVLGDSGYGAFETGGNAMAYSHKTIEEDYIHIRSRRLGVQTRLEGLTKLVEQDPDFVPMAQTGSEGVLNELRRLLDQDRAELARLLVQYREDSEWIKRQRSLIEEGRRKLHVERDLFLAELALEMEELLATENELKRAVDVELARLTAYPEIARQMESLDLQIKAKYDLMEVLQTKRGEVRLQAMADHRISQVIPLDEPTIDTWGSGGKKFLYLILVSGFAVVLGFLIALFVENQDHRLHDQHKAEQYLQVPVLGAISSPQSRDRAS